MLNRVTITGKLLDAPKIRTYESRGDKFEIVSLWVEVKDDHRIDRFSIDVACPRQVEVAKRFRADVLVEVAGKLRHDRWKDKETGRWIGKVYVAIDPGEGTLRSKGLVAEDQSAVDAA